MPHFPIATEPSRSRLKMGLNHDDGRKFRGHKPLTRFFKDSLTEKRVLPATAPPNRSKKVKVHLQVRLKRLEAKYENGGGLGLVMGYSKLQPDQLVGAGSRSQLVMRGPV
jgi:hypothetical protein